MKVIDLLNKIANGEEVPKKIKTNSSVLTLNEDEDNYLYDTNDEYWGNLFIHWFDLNDEVEIIEEDKKIEKVMGIDTRETRDCIITFQEKLNELIEEVNKLKESK